MKIANYSVGKGQPLLLIAGPCVIESEELCREVATHMKALCAERGVNYVFKASFDKANRTSIHSYRGPGLKEGWKRCKRLRMSTRFRFLPIFTKVRSAKKWLPCAMSCKFRLFCVARPTCW
jgi:2-dehydro-3-deoxyphosphooctonate aldolase (KDO 8-P synthase)